MAGKLKHTMRVMASNERGNPLSIEDLEQFCRTARAQGVPGYAQVVATHPGGVGDHIVDIFADRVVEPDPVLDPPFTDIPQGITTASVRLDSGSPAGRYVGLSADVPSVGTRGEQPPS